MLSRLILVIALLAGLALFIQAPAQASDRDGYYRHDRYDRYDGGHRAPGYYEPRRFNRGHYRHAPRYRHERYRHAHRHDHRRHHRDYYYSDRRW